MFVIKILANRDAIFFVSSDQNMLLPDFVDTFNGFVVHLKWILWIPLVLIYWLNLILKQHFYCSQYPQTRIVTWFEQRQFIYWLFATAFCLTWILWIPLMDLLYTRSGFVVHLKWIWWIPWVDFVDTFSLNILINHHTETALFIALSTHKPALLRDSGGAN